MEVQQGSGTYVASKENAQIFIEKYKNVQSVQEIRQDLLESVQRQKEELDEFSDLLNVLVSQTKKVHDISTFVPYELKITGEAQHLEESISDLHIWQNRCDHCWYSNRCRITPFSRPYAKLSAGNTIYYVGNELVLTQRMMQLFYPNK